MTEDVRYRFIMQACLQREDKTVRDAVLAQYPEAVQLMVRKLMEGLARRQAARLRSQQTRDRRELSDEECKRLYRERLAAIDPEWLRHRVDRMLREQARYIQQQRQQLREAIQ